MAEHKPPTGSAWPSFRRWSWVGLFAAAGVLATLVVLGPWRQLAPEGWQSQHAEGTTAQAPASPAVERRSLMAETSRPATGHDNSQHAENGPGTRPGEPAIDGTDDLAPATPSDPVAAPRTRTTTAQATGNPARATRATPPRRKRAARPELEDAPSAEGELDGLFNAPSTIEGRPSREAASARELDGLFPTERQVTLGANGSPLPD
jgi:hypothetical protein